MRKILLATLGVAFALSASATSFKEKFHLDEPLTKQKELQALNPVARHGAQKSSSDALITDPQGTGSRYAMAVDIYLSHMGATHVGGFGAEVITDENSFFSRAFTLNFFQQGYSEGKIEGDKVVFNSGQYIYDTDDGEKACMYAAYLEDEEAWPVLVDTFTLTKDDSGRYVSEPDYYFMVLTEEVAEIAAEEGLYEDMDIICFGTNYVFTPLPADAADNLPPADAETYDCQLNANSLSNMGEKTTINVKVSVSGDNIYIGGLSDYLPTACLMGSKTGENTYTFDSHQYIGYFDIGDYPYIYEFITVNPIYFNGESLYFDATESVTMSFDEDKTTLTPEDGAGIFISAYGDINTWNEVYWNMMIGDFNKPLTPSEPIDVNCYPSMNLSYIVFEWSDISTEGIPMIQNNLWCEVIINGQPYTFLPEYYKGLSEPTEKIYFNTSNVDGLYTGEFTTIYLYEFAGHQELLKTIGLRIGYEGVGEIRYSDIIYADGFEPFDDNAFVPSRPSDLVFYKEYYNCIRFKFDGKDTEGNPIPDRLMAVELLIDGQPFEFKDEKYYFQDGNGPDVTVVGLSEHSLNYSYSLVTHFSDEYILALWDDEELGHFKTLEVRPVCTGGDTFTYGEGIKIDLERAAIPANPWNVTFDEDSKNLEFGALPIGTDRLGLAPWNYGYEVYVNDELFTFKSNMYDLENDITLIPYEGFEYNYYFYLHSQNVYEESDWSLIGNNIIMSVDMDREELDIKKIGVRAVYTDGEGLTTYSDIINTDGTVGVDSVSTLKEPIKWYNLQGIEVSQPLPGAVYLKRQGSSSSKVFVR